MRAVSSRGRESAVSQRILEFSVDQWAQSCVLIGCWNWPGERSGKGIYSSTRVCGGNEGVQ